MKQETSRKPKVIIVDDDRDTREMLTLALELEGFDVGQAANGLRLISAMHVDRPDVIGFVVRARDDLLERQRRRGGARQ